MLRQLGRLSAKKVEKARKPGYYGDGGGLWLQVTPSGSKSWVFRFMLSGKAREMGIGGLAKRSLSEARTKAADCRKLLADDIDPIEARDAGRVEQALDAAKSITFSEAAKQYIAAHRAGWKNAKHVAQWENTINTYCGPVFGALPVQAVDTGLVLKVLEPLWTTKTETASRLRGRIEQILDWARTRGYRAGDNPARWRGHMDKLLPNRAKVQTVMHQPALPYTQIAAFLVELRKQEGITARALEFMILTAVRTQAVRFATWDEIDFDEKTWDVPADHMKMKKDHRVPLCERALAILEEMKKLSEGDESYVFPGGKRGRPMSDAGMLAVLKRMNPESQWVDDKTGEKIVPHGFRSTFRDWAAECTSYPREVCEMALAHAVSNQVEAAYRRGDLFDKRRRLMAEWAKHCDNTRRTGKVISLARRRA